MKFLPIFWLILSVAQAELHLTQVDAMTRVLRTEAVKDAEVVMEAARGEWESMQIIATGTAEEIQGITLEATAMIGEESSKIPAPVILREHYVRVVKSTPMSPLPPGDYPDALIPQDFPWQKLPEEKSINQPFWVDVFVPYNTKPGLYSSDIVIKDANGSERQRTKISLRVLAFDLPVLPRLKSSVMTSWRRMLEVHGFDHEKDPPEPEGITIIEKYYDLMVQHRLSYDQSRQTYPSPITGKLDEEQVEKAMRKHLLHRHTGMICLPLWPTWPFADPLEKDREEAMRYVADWMKILRNLHCESRGYMNDGDLDEPNSAEAYAYVRRWGDFYNEVEARYGVRIPLVVTEQPTPDSMWWGNLDSFVDIWAPHFGSVWEDMEGPKGKRDIARRLKAGDEVWCYAALVQMPNDWEAAHGRPATIKESNPPVWCLDFPPMNHRILSWVIPRHGITGICYWDTLYVHPGVDVWTQADTFHSDVTDEVFNGDGSFVYPGTKKRHGRDTPVASIRLKWLREMSEDYDYLMLAKDLGLEREAMAKAASFARGFGDWNNDMTKLYNARRAIAAMIVKKGGGK